MTSFDISKWNSLNKWCSQSDFFPRVYFTCMHLRFYLLTWPIVRYVQHKTRFEIRNELCDWKFLGSIASSLRRVSIALVFDNSSLREAIHVHAYVSVHMYVCMCVYVYVNERERGGREEGRRRERDSSTDWSIVRRRRRGFLKRSNL